MRIRGWWFPCPTLWLVVSPSSLTRTIIWFRRDLRCSDHQPLLEASRLGTVLPLFVLDRQLLFHPETGVARVAFLLATLQAFDQDLRRRGGRLLVRFGDPAAELLRLVREGGATGVMAHTDSERIVGRVRDARVNRLLAAAAVPIRWVEPVGAVDALVPYTRYRQLWQQAVARTPLPAPRQLMVPAPADPDRPTDPADPLADLPVPSLEALGLQPDGKPLPPAGSAAAQSLLRTFLEGPAAQTYYWELSVPSARVTTGLSPHLKFGVLSPRQVVARLAPLVDHPDDRRQRSARQLISRLRWGTSMAQRFRYLPQLELRSLWRCFDQEPWPFNEELYDAWKEGRTGFPMVDAAARCLRGSGGWQELNFRSRAIYASFLANLCGIDWRFGALHFMRHLIDGDCPIDHYQWAMQAGVTQREAQAWTRIYHPGAVAVQRCDPQGLFIRRWLPELAELTNDQLACPPPMAAYPAPILSYEQARRERIRQLAARREAADPALNPARQMAAMPGQPVPFGADRLPAAVVAWAQQERAELFPPPLELAALDPPAQVALESWFRPGVPPGPTRPAAASRHRRGSSGRVNPDQLELWP